MPPSPASEEATTGEKQRRRGGVPKLEATKPVCRRPSTGMDATHSVRRDRIHNNMHTAPSTAPILATACACSPLVEFETSHEVVCTERHSRHQSAEQGHRHVNPHHDQKLRSRRAQLSPSLCVSLASVFQCTAVATDACVRAFALQSWDMNDSGLLASDGRLFKKSWPINQAPIASSS